MDVYGIDGSSANVAFLAVPVRSIPWYPLPTMQMVTRPFLAGAEHFCASLDRLPLLYPLFHALNGHRGAPRLEAPPSRRRR